MANLADMHGTCTWSGPVTSYHVKLETNIDSRSQTQTHTAAHFSDPAKIGHVKGRGLGLV